MADILITSTADNNSLTLIYVDMLDTCKEAIKIHETSKIASRLFCEALIGGALLSHSLKEDSDSLLLILRGDGPVGGVTIRSEKKGEIKGYLYYPQAEADDTAELLGSGVFSLVKDLGLRGTYTGNLPLLTGKVGENITAYFAESEQITSSCGIDLKYDDDGELVAAAGFLLQLLPDASYDIIEKLEEDLRRHVNPAELAYKYKNDYVKILSEILPSFEVKILEKTPLKWVCNCSRDRMHQALVSIGKDELESVIQDGDELEVVCDYCKKKYTFNPDEIKKTYEEV